MNWVEIVILLVIGLSAYKAYNKGFILSLFNLCALLVTIFLTIQLYPMGSKIIFNFTNLDESLRGSVSKSLDLEREVNESVSLEEQIGFIDNLPLPESLKENLMANNNYEVYDLLKVSRLEDYITGYIARIAVNIIAFIIIFILLYIILNIVVRTLNILSKLPLINSVNKLLGLVFGSLLGVIRVWFIFFVMTLYSANPKMGTVFDMIAESQWLSFLYNNNLLLKAVIDLSKTIL
jgi:uncharacterized membrane protein required for colicin V production